MDCEVGNRHKVVKDKRFPDETKALWSSVLEG